MLNADIRRIDVDTRWNDFYFAPLDAEIIIEEVNKTKRKSSNLIKAMKNKSNENAYLILGEPGSGKSTVLRMLAKDLLKEVKKTNKIPLYINLKEWNTNKIFMEDSQPKIQHLFDFIKENLKDRLGDVFTSDFLAEYFDELYEQGCFYFIFDSFDEIPMLLDESETSWLVDKISALLYQLTAQNRNTTVILSSRFFRQPTEQFHARIKMHIKPFSETSIRECFKRIAGNGQLASKLFSDHKELINIAKNPFYASLISLNYKDTQQIPVKEVELYESFIKSRLEKCNLAFGDLTNHEIKISDVIEYTKEIAVTIFSNTQYGIEIPLQELYKNIDVPEYVVEILKKAKLIRVGGGKRKTISFSHRRFNEYFVACSLMNRNIESYIDSIPTNSKWRDTLVLYAQICSEDKKDKLVQFCCSFLSKVNVIEKKNESIPNDLFYTALHSLRFITVAFSSQTACLQSFQEDIVTFIKLLLSSNNLFFYKIGVQSVPILSDKNMNYVLTKTFEKEIPWINEVAILNISYLDTISTNMFLAILKYFTFMSPIDFFRRFKMHIFYLSLTPNFKKIRSVCFSRLVGNIILFVIGSFLIYIFKDRQIILLTEANDYRLNNLFSLFIFLSSLTIMISWLNKMDMSFLLSTPLLAFSVLNFGFLCIMASFVIIVPYYYFSILRNNKSRKLLIKNGIKRLKIFAFTLLIVIVLLIIKKYFPKQVEILLIILLIVLLVMLIILLVLPLIYFIDLIKDRRIFSKFEFFSNMKRDDVYESLTKLSTTRFQRKYLLKLSEKGVQLTGIPEFKLLPRLNNDILAQILAQIEEKSFAK